MKNKLLPDLKTALIEAGLADGMTISFHHHLRNGDFVVNMVLEAAAALGRKNLTVALSSVFPVHKPIVDHIKSGLVTGLDTDYMSGSVAMAVSNGVLARPVIFRSHGGRPRAIGEGSLKIDIAFVAAPCVDSYGNISGAYGPSACGSLGYIIPDTQQAAVVVAVTDNLSKNRVTKVSVPHNRVDYVVKVDKIGDPEGIVTGSISLTRDPVALVIARSAQAAIRASGLLKDGFNYQTGAGGASLAASIFLREDMHKLKLHGGFLLGGITRYMVEMLEENLFDNIFDVQCFDLTSVESLRRNSGHLEISADSYANPKERSCYVDYLDVVLLGGSEIDLEFNVNVTTDSNGLIIGGSGGHNDAAAGAKMTVIVAPLMRSRLPIVVERCTTVTTPGSTVDVLVTEYGLAVNPRRGDLIDRFKEAKLTLFTIEELRTMALKVTGVPKKIRLSDKIVGLLEYRDGTVLDSIYGQL